MKECIKCNQSYDDNIVFCPKCGTKLLEKSSEFFCAYCGEKLPSNITFCPFCGNKIIVPKEDINTENVESTYSDKGTDGTSYDNIRLGSDSISEKDDPTYAKPFSKTGLFNYRGRRSRSDYFKVGCTTAIIHNTVKKIPVVNIIILALLIYINFTNASKRLHDINKPTSWAIGLAVLDMTTTMVIEYGNSLVSKGEPFNTVMTIYVIAMAMIFLPRIILLCIKGTDGPNQYGPDPLVIDEK